MQAETKFKKKVLAKLDKLAPWVYYIKIQQVAKRGDPDILLCVLGEFWAWELKDTGKKATKLQAYVLNSIMEAGGRTRVVTPENFDGLYHEIIYKLNEDVGFIYS